MRTREILGVVLGVLVLVGEAWANVQGGGGSRILGTDFLVELFAVATNVWIPVILVITGVAVIGGMAAGVVRMSAGVAKWVVIILMGGAGVTGIANMLGLNTAIALVW